MWVWYTAKLLYSNDMVSTDTLYGKVQVNQCHYIIPISVVVLKIVYSEISIFRKSLTVRFENPCHQLTVLTYDYELAVRLLLQQNTHAHAS